MGGPLRATIRFAASVLITTGSMLLVDAALTVLWQEPISYLIAKRGQAGLSDDLGGLERRYEPDGFVDAGILGRKLLATLAATERRRADEGDAIGRIRIPRPRRSFVVVQGTETAPLRKGPGHYPDTPFPGESGTVAIAGHRTTWLAPFRRINRLRRHDRIVLTMPYGRFTYSVERRRIVVPRAVWVKKPRRYDRLILTACHPLYSAARRIVVFARLAKSEIRIGALKVRRGRD